MKKLTKLQVIIIGVIVNLIVAGGGYWFLIKPRQEALKQVQTQLEQRTQVAEGRDNALADRDRAERENLRARLDYREYEVTKMPALSFENRAQGMIALWREQAEVLGPMIQNWPRKYGVEVLNQVSIPAATSNPASIPDGLIRIDVGQMEVRGDLQSIMNHLRGWNEFGRLVEISPLSLEGLSPALTATYNLSVLIYPRGKMGPAPDMAGAGDPNAAAAGGAPAPAPTMPSGAGDAPPPPASP